MKPKVQSLTLSFFILIFLFAAIHIEAQSNLQNGLWTHFDFSDTPSGTTLTDVSSNSNNGNIVSNTNNTLTASIDPCGNDAFQFSTAENTHIEVPTSSAGESFDELTITVSFLIDPTISFPPTGRWKTLCDIRDDVTGSLENRVGIWVDMDNMELYAEIKATGVPISFTLSGGTIVPGQWQQAVLVIRNASPRMELYLDCQSVDDSNILTTPLTFANDDFWTIGSHNLLGTPSQYMIGEIGEVRIYDRELNAQEVEDICLANCIDATGCYLDIDGDRHADINLNNLEIEMRDYWKPILPITEICSGDPVHIRLLKNGHRPRPIPNAASFPVLWEYNDGGGWIPLNSTLFNGYSFPVLSGNITIDCINSQDGFVDRRFRAVGSITDIQGNTCDYMSNEYQLRICCPIRPATVQVMPNDSLCESDNVMLSIDLISPDPFVQTPGPNVDIEWYFDNVLLANQANQTQFTYNLTVPAVNVPTDLCFKAVINNCAGKLGTATTCLHVDPKPVCGTIIGLPNPPNLTQIVSSPNPVYSICPGNDAKIGIDIPFDNCIPEWQYSFDGGSTWNWVPEGSISNSELNTNELPWDFNWQANANSIWYRIQCNPLSSPSGCEPCYSDTLEIQLLSAPPPDFIVGQNQACKENLPVSLAVNAYDPTYTYTWFCDGLEVGAGQSFAADQSACYWVETSNGCQITISPQHCVEVCEVIPILSCPLIPNECASLGNPITLSACDSELSCGDNSGFIYTWFIDGVQQSGNNCQLMDTPPVNGSLYEISILDTVTGCSAGTEIFIKPCDKQ